MRIVCPSCQAAYEVPEKLLSGAPRKVRCARCGNSWVPEAVVAPVVEAAPPPAPESEREPEPIEPAPVRAAPPPAVVVPRAEDRLVPEPAESPGRGPVLLAALAWAVSVVLFAGAAWGIVLWRAEIMAAWAPSRWLFSLLGLA